MKISRSYRLPEFLSWTRRRLYVVLVLAVVPVVLYQVLGQTWIALPWSLAVLLGTAASFIVGFKNVQTYNLDSWIGIRRRYNSFPLRSAGQHIAWRH